MKQKNLDLFDELPLLTQEILKHHFFYDEITGFFTFLTGRKKGEIAGFKTSQGYLAISINSKTYLCHRLAWLYVYGCFPLDGKVIDHKNGIRTDNFISNLRMVSYSENVQNQRFAPKNSSTGFLGVQRYSLRNCFRARLKVNGKVVFQKNFKTLEEANKAYVLAKRKYHSSCTI